MTDILPAVEHLAELAAIAQLSVGDYYPIRSGYKMEVKGHIDEYLYSDNVKITRFRNSFKRAILEAFYPAFEQGLMDGGGEAPAQDEDLDWINARVDRELTFVDDLFEYLKDLKKQAKEEDNSIFEGVSELRSEGYARTLDGIYSTGKIMAKKNIMLTFGGPDGVESCAECKKLKGQRHRASWWIGHGLLLTRGNENYTCGVYHCEHHLYDVKGNVYTV
jgi:hypothetical protein